MKDMGLKRCINGTAIAVAGILFGATVTLGLAASAAPSDPGAHSTDSTSESSATSVSVRQVDCAGPFVAGGDYSNCDLRGRVFRDLSLRSARFDNARLDGALFDVVDLSHASFMHASLADTHFNMVTFDSVDFTDATLDVSGITASHGDGLSAGLAAWVVPTEISAVADSDFLDLTSQLGTYGIVSVSPTGPRCSVPLTSSDGFALSPVHLINCPSSPVQWGWQSVYKGSFPLDGLPIMNLSSGEQSGHITATVRDNFGHTAEINVTVNVQFSTKFTVGKSGEFWVW